MLRDIADPWDTGRLQRNSRVKASGDGAVNNGLPLLVEQGDHFSLRSDDPVDPLVRVIEEPSNSFLFFNRRDWHVCATHSLVIYVLSLADARDEKGEAVDEIWRLEEVSIKAALHFCFGYEDSVCRADDASAMRNFDAAFKRSQADYKIPGVD